MFCVGVRNKFENLEAKEVDQQWEYFKVAVKESEAKQYQEFEGKKKNEQVNGEMSELMDKKGK